jgi:hypothetical protein
MVMAETGIVYCVDPLPSNPHAGSAPVCGTG